MMANDVVDVDKFDHSRAPSAADLKHLRVAAVLQLDAPVHTPTRSVSRNKKYADSGFDFWFSIGLHLSSPLI